MFLFSGSDCIFLPRGSAAAALTSGKVVKWVFVGVCCADFAVVAARISCGQTGKVWGGDGDNLFMQSGVDTGYSSLLGWTEIWIRGSKLQWTFPDLPGRSRTGIPTLMTVIACNNENRSQWWATLSCRHRTNCASYLSQHSRGFPDV